MNIFELFEYSFIQNALIASILIVLVNSILGMFLVLSRYSLIADGLSHLNFGVIAISIFFGILPFEVSVIFSILGSILIYYLSKKSKLYGDLIIGIISALGMSLGVLAVSIKKGFNIDVYGYLFGNVLTISKSELNLILVTSVLILIILFFNFKELLSITFDSEYAKILGLKVEFKNILLFALTGLAVSIGIKLVGAVLAGSMIILPVAIGLSIAKGIWDLFYKSVFFGIFSVLVGFIFGLILNLPIGATIVLTNVLIFILLRLFVYII